MNKQALYKIKVYPIKHKQVFNEKLKLSKTKTYF